MTVFTVERFQRFGILIEVSSFETAFSRLFILKQVDEVGIVYSLELGSGQFGERRLLP